jgi:hypothetical protein
LKRGLVLVSQNLITLDTNTVAMINGDDGGAWTPSSSIQVAGAGVKIFGPWTMGSGVKVVTGFGGRNITFGQGSASDYFGYAADHPDRSPSVFTHFQRVFIPVPFTVLQSGNTGFTFLTLGAHAIVPINVYGGASKIDAVFMQWAVSQTHANLPQYLPQMRVIAVDADGTIIPLRTADSTTDVDGFQYFIPSAATGTAYYNAGAIQQWAYTCNVVLPMDLSLYQFFIEVIEESGTNAWTAGGGNRFQNATVNHSNVLYFDNRN